MTLHRARTEVSVATSVEEIHECLRTHGARAVLYEYDGQGEVEALNFKVRVGETEIAFRLPADWRPVHRLLQGQMDRGHRARANEAQAKRVTWRILREWVYAQCAILESELVSVEQVFLPFALTAGGQTVYERWRQSRFVLPAATPGEA